MTEREPSFGNAPPSFQTDIAQETLAEMIGTTRSRVNFFLNRFKRLGLIDYQAGLPFTVNTTSLTALLQD